MKLGRLLPGGVGGQRELLTTSSPPSTSCTERFILPASSEKMRSLRILASSLSSSVRCVAAFGAHQREQAGADLADGFTVDDHARFEHMATVIASTRQPYDTAEYKVRRLGTMTLSATTALMTSKRQHPHQQEAAASR